MEKTYILSNLAVWFDGLLRNTCGLPNFWTVLIECVLVGLLILTAYAVLAIVLIFMERKVCAYFQCRIGPMRVGPWGTLQVIADVLKMLIKEIFFVDKADKLLYAIAPFLVIIASVGAFSFLPWNQGWEVLNFNEVITGAALVTLTRLKAETMNAEFDAVNMLYKKVSKGDMSFDQIAMISRPTKGTYILQGGTYETKINVGAYDSRQKFTATVNGQQLTSGDSGSVVYRTTCNNLGPQRVTGTAYVTSPDGGTKEYPINDVYYVAKPAGVVRLDGLQVVYAGLDNPITISAAGIDTRNLTASIEGGQATLTRGEGEGSYILKPAPGSKTLNIQVNATIDKRTTTVGTQKVIVKNIPAPIISVAGVQNGGRIAKKDISTSTAVIPAKNPDFLLKIDNRLIRIIKFTMAVGAREAVSNSPRFTEEQVSIVRKAVKGDKLVILAEVMMPDGKPNTVTYTATIK